MAFTYADETVDCCILGASRGAERGRSGPLSGRSASSKSRGRDQRRRARTAGDPVARRASCGRGILGYVVRPLPQDDSPPHRTLKAISGRAHYRRPYRRRSDERSIKSTEVRLGRRYQLPGRVRSEGDLSVHESARSGRHSEDSRLRQEGRRRGAHHWIQPLYEPAYRTGRRSGSQRMTIHLALLVRADGKQAYIIYPDGIGQ